MGKKSPSPPPAPDPAATAAAQGAANVETAIAQNLMNRTNQTSPFGNITYNQIGSQKVGDKDVPLYEQVTTLSPSGQRQLDLTNQLSESALGVGNTAFGNVASQLQTPFNPTGLPALNTDAGAAREKAVNDLYGLQTKRLDDRLGREQSALETRLANQGIQQGSEAYTNAMKDFNYGKNDAYDQAMATALAQGTSTAQAENAMNLGNRQQGFQEQSYQRSLPLNELSALLGFSGGVSNPQFNPVPQTGVANTDVAGIIGNNYANQMNAYNAAQARSQGFTNSLMGLGGSLGSAAIIASDIRVKEDIVNVGFLNNGLPVYLFRYKGEDKFQMGLMAQDVEKVHPHAVVEIGGIKHVNYMEAVQ